MTNARQITDTRELIAAITDEGLFERLAASTLRIADPLYRGLVETGTNARGRTIRDPADGIVFATDAAGRRYAIVAHHTITARARLRAKWLDPEEGDIAKALAVFERSAKRVADLERRLVLTCSFDPDSTLVADLEADAANLGIEIDLWAGARLAHTLDVEPDGQWVRARTLSVPQRRLSVDLARDIGRRLVEAARPQANPAEFIKREVREVLDDQVAIASEIVFVTGRSGVGKSVLCYDLAKDAERSGGAAIVLSEKVVEEALTLEDALQRAFKAYAPDLSEPDFTGTLTHLFQGRDIVIWVEDINRASAPVDLVQKLLRWTRTATPNEQAKGESPLERNSLKFICPVWLDHLAQLSRPERDSVDAHSLLVDEYSKNEGGDAVLQRACRAGAVLTPLEAQSIAEAIGHDPLLIGLVTDWHAHRPGDVIGAYLEDECRKLAAASEYQSSEIRSVLHRLASAMITNRSVSPSWTDALAWMPSALEQDILRHVVKHSLAASVSNQDTLQFRHDRVRDHLFSSVIADTLLKGEADPDLIRDPYFARVVGEAVLMTPDISAGLDGFDPAAPLALFYGFAAAVRYDHPMRATLYNTCEVVLTSEGFEQRPQSERFAINNVLAELDGDDVLDLLRKSPGPCFAKEEGLARNGDVPAAAAFCYRHDPHTPSSRRDRLIAHARFRHGNRWIKDIGDFIANPDNKGKCLEGGLFLAGELGHKDLVAPLKSRWQRMRASGDSLTGGLLYAVVTSAPGRDEVLANDAIAAWAALPDKDPKNPHSNPRADIATYGLGGGLRRHENDRVISCLLRAHEKFSALKHAIVWTMRAIDHPLAVRCVAEAVAEIDRRCEETGGFNIWGTHFTDHWGRRRRPNHRRMGVASRAALKVIWDRQENDLWLRKRAFDLWSASLMQNEIADLAAAPPAGLEDRSLAVRLRHGDQSAKPELAARIEAEENSWYWLQFARCVGTMGLEATLGALLEKRRRLRAECPEDHFPADDCLPELLADRDDAFALELLMSHWDHLAASPGYVIALLYLATPDSLALAEKEIRAAEDPKEVLEFIDMRMGIKVVDRPGLKRLVQAQALLPYLEHFSDMAKWSFWGECNRRGWFEWRQKYLDPLICFPADRTFARIDERADFEWLDRQMAQDQFVLRHSHNWSKGRLEAGISPAEIVDRAERYARSRSTEDAFGFFADVVSEHGTRRDLSRLNMDWALTRQNCVVEVANACFAVKIRRTD